MNQKDYYMVEIEAWVPVTIKYRVLSESPEKAIREVKMDKAIQAPKLKLSAMKRISASVYKFGTSILLHRFKY